MNAALETLLQIQDLKAQRKELEEGEAGRQMQEEEFNLDVEGALADLDTKIGELEAELEPQVRSRYQRVSKGLSRPVVPVINGLCYGCFVAVPTAVASEVTDQTRIRHCDHCGRFLYFVR